MYFSTLYFVCTRLLLIIIVYTKKNRRKNEVMTKTKQKTTTMIESQLKKLKEVKTIFKRLSHMCIRLSTFIRFGCLLAICSLHLSIASSPCYYYLCTHSLTHCTNKTGPSSWWQKQCEAIVSETVTRDEYFMKYIKKNNLFIMFDDFTHEF